MLINNNLQDEGRQYFTCAGKTVKDLCYPTTRENWEKMRRKPELAQTCARIENGEEALKTWLPVWTPHCAEFRNNHRSSEDAMRPLRRLMLDFDEKGHTDEIWARLQERSPLEVLLVEESVRRGTHVLVRLPQGMKPQEAMDLMAEATGFEPDRAVKDVARCIYMVPESHTKYVSEKLFDVEGDEIDDDAAAEPEVKACASPQPSNDTTTLTFQGIPYSAIINEYWKRDGGEPVEGNRNNKLYPLAMHLCSICGNSEELLLKIMPTYGLDIQEMQNLVHSACNATMEGSYVMFQIVKDLLASRLAEENQNEDDGEKLSTTQKQINVNVKTLPVGLRESLVGVPQNMQMPVLCAVLPLAAAYADQVEVKYCDGTLQYLGLMSIIRGEQASGKSVCTKAIDIWKQQLEENDKLGWKHEAEWKERKKSSNASEKLPEIPKEVIRMVPITISVPQLLYRLKNAQGHCLYSFGEELDTLIKTNKAGSWSQKYDIYRLAFDRGEMGQDFYSADTESGTARVNYNWTMLGTNGAFNKLFKDNNNVENGLSTRMLVAEMPDNLFEKMPKYKQRTEDEKARIQQAVKILSSQSGYVDTPRLRKAIDKWVEEKRVEALEANDRVMAIYRKRAAVIGFRCGVIFHLLTGKDYESKSCLDFATTMADYALAGQIEAFGEELRKLYDAPRRKKQKVAENDLLFKFMPSTFTTKDLKPYKPQATTDTLRVITNRWGNNGLCKSNGKGVWTKTDKV